MIAVVENHYIHQDKNEEEQKEASHLKVYCREPEWDQDVWEEIRARPQGGPIYSSPNLNADNGIEIYVKETHPDSPTYDNKQRFGYIRVYTEWSEKNTYEGCVAITGTYDSREQEQKATIRLLHIGPGHKPKTVNVQVGGN